MKGHHIHSLNVTLTEVSAQADAPIVKVWTIIKEPLHGIGRWQYASHQLPQVAYP